MGAPEHHTGLEQASRLRCEFIRLDMTAQSLYLTLEKRQPTKIASNFALFSRFFLCSVSCRICYSVVTRSSPRGSPLSLYLTLLERGAASSLPPSSSPIHARHHQARRPYPATRRRGRRRRGRREGSVLPPPLEELSRRAAAELEGRGGGIVGARR
ncbi:hypothetical protein E2562_003795 [Oryza meyeriana var. granulata]|uniref:Uncharacterized protein n=1 Tax=Oryza meyeriana var. granulata TaxID=110450 RepID=A0A6G1BRY5_9ORYZ|nr:hypothetical protein E2562_003795 [Oryza meyeriana var. granulata]